MFKRHKNDIALLLKNNGVDADKVADVIEEMENIINDVETDEQKNSFHGFKIGDRVSVSGILRGGRQIIGYNGLPMGFRMEDVGKIGVIKKFNKKTMGVENVCVVFHDKEVWGTIDLLKPLSS